MIELNGPLTKDKIKDFKAGQEVLFTGVVYTARDQAHKRLVDMINKNQALPFDLKDKVIYYAGPTPARPGDIIGSCGPTTSSRMDKYTLSLLKEGISAMIGKGQRSRETAKNIKKHKCVYFLAPAGCGALINEKIKKSEIIAFENLGAEAIYKLNVEKFPLIVGIDSNGNDILSN